MNTLTNKQEDICSYAGLFGALLSATCLVQLMIIAAKTNWLVMLLVLIYLFAITSFSLFAFQKSYSPVLLIVSAALSLISELLLIMSGLFSLIVILLFIYNVIIVIVIYAEALNEKLKEKGIALREEKKSWEGKI